MIIPMIFDSLQNMGVYESLSAHFAAAFEFLQRPEAAQLADGKYPIDGDRVFAIVQTYPTKPIGECFWESHQKYIDVQYMVDGMEGIFVSPMERMKIKTPYDASRDVIVLEGEGPQMQLTGGNVFIFFPHDAHMPCVRIGRSQPPIKKIVVKVAV